MDEERLNNDVEVNYNKSGRVVRVEVHNALKRMLLNVVKGLAKASKTLSTLLNNPMIRYAWEDAFPRPRN